MKSFLKIGVGAALLFIAAAMAQEWEVFSQPWFAPPGGETSELPDETKKEVADTLLLYLKITSHLYGTGGDPRFAERIPASSILVEEAQREIAYLRHHQLIEEPTLQRMEIVSIDRAGGDLVEVKTREFWITRRYVIGEEEPIATRSSVISNLHLLKKDGDSWVVMSWEPAPELPDNPEETG